jgi:NitT/TauT family transport system ATP-binding protein
MIRLDGVGQVFEGRGGKIQALEGIDLHVQENEFVTLIGRSGCGKSTLLRLIAGLLPPTYGGVEVAGEAVKGPRRDVSFMFQRPALLPWRSVVSNVLLPVEISGGKDKSRDKKAYRDRAHELLEMVGLSGFERRLPHELSGGMQQRVSLCRSLIRDPKVMLMDEPFSALDALTRTELSEELQRIQMELATTIVFVTHSIEEAVLLADRVVVLSPRPGRLREIVEIDIARPRSLGQDAQVADVARISSRLHSLLSEKAPLQDSAENAPQLSGNGSRPPADVPEGRR